MFVCGLRGGTLRTLYLEPHEMGEDLDHSSRISNTSNRTVTQSMQGHRESKLSRKGASKEQWRTIIPIFFSTLNVFVAILHGIPGDLAAMHAWQCWHRRIKSRHASASGGSYHFVERGRWLWPPRLQCLWPRSTIRPPLHSGDELVYYNPPGPTFRCDCSF